MGAESLVTLLLQHGADLNARRTDHDDSVLQIAILRHKREVLIKSLLEHGADINLKTGKWVTALQAAVHIEDVGVIRLLLQHGADTNVPRLDFRTTLATAVYKGREDIAQLLLEYGADVHAQDPKGHTALHTAAWRGSSHLIELLMSKGAVVDVRVKECETVLEIACRRGNTNAIETLVRAGASMAGTRFICYVLIKCAAEVLLKLLQLGLDVKSPIHGTKIALGLHWCISMNEPRYALSLALYLGHKDKIQGLLYYGATTATSWHEEKIARFRDCQWYEALRAAVPMECDRRGTESRKRTWSERSDCDSGSDRDEKSDTEGASDSDSDSDSSGSSGEYGDDDAMYPDDYGQCQWQCQ